ncbi:unnamed protein product [Candida verbasci]|uniref:Major facilitator superfamily (MFS) profile domain-containing protein n=1 Tax=Candida verbasci TaxID=1227364 RepID=A0A9W4TVY3_9ASCO|nr:unnamed protein product [Candida verbasci]
MSDISVEKPHQDGLFDNSSSSPSLNKQDPLTEDNNEEVEREAGERGNILSQYTEKQAMQMGRNYASKNDLDPELFAKAAALARAPGAFNSMNFLTDEEKSILYKEATKKWFLRKKMIAVVAVGAMAAAVQGMDESVGIGIKSATVPPYAAECAPKHVRGALVMLWQFFTAVGIMFGYVASLAFYYVPKHGIESGINWRLMLGSACIPAIIVLFQIPYVPESPRWLMGKGRHREAYESLNEMRLLPVAAARDSFYQYVLLQEEGSLDIPTWKRIIQMFTITRNRNAVIGSWIVMFMQQFCGINVIAYYSSSIFRESGFDDISALLASWGFGMVNFIFAIPAFLTIDKFGRRALLLTTFPLMCIFLLITGFGFLIHESNRQGRLAMVATGIYIYSAIYSSGEGPVPFTYSAEAFPLYIRDLGMSWATATCCGAFGFYAGWNLVGFFLVLWFLPETKGLTLEELDDVFAVPAHKHAAYQTKAFWNGIQRHIFRKQVEPLPPLYKNHRMAVTNDEWNEKTEVSHVE